MKKYPIAMYCIWPDYDYIEKFIQAGGNTIGVILNNFSLEDDMIHNHYGHYETAIAMLEKYSDDPRVDIVLIPQLVKTFEDIPDDQCFHNGEEYIKRSPCPTSEDYIISRLKTIKALCSAYNIKNVQFDVEHYNWRGTRVERVWDGKWKPDHKCHCKRCKDFSKKEQWKIHNKLFNKHLKKIDLTESGQLAYFNMWNFNKYIGKKWLYTENTYPVHKKPSSKLYRKYWGSHWGRKFFSRFLYKQDIHISAGLWIEKFNANDFIKWIERYGKCSLYDGYWIYPQGRLSKHSRFPKEVVEDERYGKLYFGLVDDENAEGSNTNFFLNLKELNEKILKYRKGWIFKLRNLIKL